MDSIIIISAVLIGLFLILTMQKGNAFLGVAGSTGSLYNGIVSTLQGPH